MLVVFCTLRYFVHSYIFTIGILASDAVLYKYYVGLLARKVSSSHSKLPL